MDYNKMLKSDVRKSAKAMGFLREPVKRKSISIFYVVFMLIVVWVAVSSTIQRFKNPKLTETELLLRIPDSFMCNWLYE